MSSSHTHPIGDNIVIKTDSYKGSHQPQYPLGTRFVRSYLESRGGLFNETVFFGLQYIAQKHLVGKVVTKDAIDRAEAFWKDHFGNKGIFKRDMWDHIANNLDGRLPIKIKAVLEGTVVPVKNVLMTIENTDEKCYALTNFLETILLQVWYPITVATYSRECKKVILQYLKETGDPSLIPFKLHDFGCRGVSSYETAAIGAASHLVNFMGTDTVAGIELLMMHYQASMCGFSIPASEHSTITSWGRDGEVFAYKNMLEKYPTGLAACVIDSFDTENAVEHLFGEVLHDLIMKREGTFVLRPDSGDPVEITLKVIEMLGKKFGYTTNNVGTGYKVLDPHVRIIQGDGINLETIKAILENFKQHGWSADNIAFGSGGKLLQAHDRDELKFAIKCSSITIGDLTSDVFKDPKTDIGKKSKRGQLKLYKDANGNYETIESNDKRYADPNYKDELVTVFENGSMKLIQNLDDVRSRANIVSETLTAA